MTDTKFLLPESAIPTHWYNVVADLPAPPAPPQEDLDVPDWLRRIFGRLG